MALVCERCGRIEWLDVQQKGVCHIFCEGCYMWISALQLVTLNQRDGSNISQSVADQTTCYEYLE